MFTVLIAALWGEKVVNSSVITNYEAATYDTTSALKAFSTYFESKGILFSDIVAAQCFLETGYLTSRMYKENNNLFGIKYVQPKKGEHPFAFGERLGHAYYLSKGKSVAHYRSYQKRMLNLARLQGRYPKNNEEYFALLEDLPHARGKRYAEDPQYIAKLREILRKEL